MKKSVYRTAALAALVALPWIDPSPAWSGGPGAERRQQLLPLGTCSEDAEQLCVDDFDCDGTCATDLSDIVIRAFLTLVSDKDSNLGDVDPIVLVKDAAGNTVPVDFSGTTLTLILEFTYQGENIVIAESYRDLGDSVIPELNIDCAGFCFPGWREPAVESFLVKVSKAGGDGSGGGDGGGGGNQGQRGVRILWATLPEPANTALKDALGLPADAVPFLEMVGERDVFDHSEEDDRLASLHRFKVTIKSAFPLP